MLSEKDRETGMCYSVSGLGRIKRASAGISCGCYRFIDTLRSSMAGMSGEGN